MRYPSIYFYTLATNNTRGFAQYIDSCAKFDVEPFILGRGQQWTGWTMKLRLLYDVLPTLNCDDIIVVTDSYDVVLQRSPNTIYNLYKRYSKPVVFSSENGPGSPNLGTILPETPDPRYRSLCAGYWMSTAQAARKMLSEAYAGGFTDDRVDDQGALQEWFVAHPDEATVDWKNTLVTTSWFVEGELDFKGPRVKNKLTGTYPCVLHMPRIDMSLVYNYLRISDEQHLIHGSQSQQMLAVNKLAFANPWPAKIPDVLLKDVELFTPSNTVMLGRILKENKIRTILEIGSWIGMGSTRFFLESGDFKGTIICNDTWKSDLSYSMFCRNNWKYNHRIIPLRYDTDVGLKMILEAGVLPDLIYVDADYSYDNMEMYLKLICELFPNSIITGDGWECYPDTKIKETVVAFSEENCMGIEADVNIWTLKRKFGC